MAKAYNMSFDTVLYDISYANMILYGAVLPSYESTGKDSTKTKEKPINADDPANRKAVEDIINNAV